MNRRPSFSELAWPDDRASANLPEEWAHSVTTQILDWTWRAFDRLQSNHLNRVDLQQPLEQLERDLTRNHFIEIQAVFQEETDGFSALIPVHEWPEMETRSAPPARPASYDLAFIHLAHRRWAWPIEAKVLPTPRNLYDYLADLTDKFEAGVAAPLIGVGGMIAYLLSGMPEAFFINLEERLPSALVVVPEFAARPHRASQHQRVNAPFICLHHMAMSCIGRQATL